MRRLILSILVILCAQGKAAASDIKVSASAEPSVVAQGEEVKLTVTIEGKFRKSSEPVLPDLDDFYVYSSGSSQSFSFINGMMSSSLVFTYTLVPRKAGKFTIAPIKFRVGNKEYEANPVTIEVAPASQKPSPPPEGAEPPKEKSTYRKHIIVSAEVDSETVYVNQQLTWTLYLYVDRRARIVRSPSFTPPEAEGFWVEDLPPQRNYTRLFNGRNYTVNELKRGYFPTSSGEYVIGPSKVTFTIDNSNISSWDDFFNDPFSSFGFGKPVTLTTKAKKITVLPLPRKGKPPDFSGIVASDLSLSISVDKQVVQVGEPVNVVLEVEATGNVKTISAPELPDLKGFKMYQSGSSSNIFRENYVVSGKKKYEYVLVPKVEGAKTLPPVKMSYFDPLEGVYKRVSSKAISLEVKPGAKEESRKVIFAGGSGEIEVLGKDINFIHPVPAIIGLNGRHIYQSKIFIVLHVFPLLAVFLSLAVERKRKRWREDSKAARAAGARKEAEKKLKAVKKLINKGDLEGAFATISEALNGYFADKMAKSASGLTFVEVKDFLSLRGVPDEQIAKAREVLVTCDASRYARNPLGIEDARLTQREASEVIDAMEKEDIR